MPVVYYELGCWEIGRSLILVLFSKQLKSKVIGVKNDRTYIVRTRLVNCSDYGSLSDESSACSVFLSNRHGEIEYSETTLRIQRAAANLKETLPIFLTFMILGWCKVLISPSWVPLARASSSIFFLFTRDRKIRSVVWILALIVLAVMASTLLSAL